MKIDLHIHTKEMFHGDGIKRNIDAKDFNSILKESNVGVAAITNHNHFDLEQFTEFKNTSSDILLLPGIEFDVSIPEENKTDLKRERRQINIIGNPNKIKEFSKKVEFALSKRENGLVCINVLVNIFDLKDTIFYPDVKRHKKGVYWEFDEIEFLSQKIKNGILVADTNNTKTRLVLMSKEYTSLIGSDLLDWDKYINESSKKLINTHISNIKDYDILLSVLSEKKSLEIYEKNSETKYLEPFNVIDEKNKKKGTIENLKITNGVNIIFGPKGSGKTDLLRSIKLKDKNAGIYYSNEYLNKYENIISDKTILQEWEEKKSSIEEMIKQISEIKKHIFYDFKNFEKSLTNSENIKLQNINYAINITKPDCKKLTDNLEMILKLKENLDEYHNENPHFRENLEEIEDFLREEYISNNKDYIKNEFKKIFAENIKEIIAKERGEISEPSEIFLYKKYENRKSINSLMKKMSEMDKEYIHEVSQHDIPGGETYRIFKKIKFIDVTSNLLFNGVGTSSKKSNKDHSASFYKLYKKIESNPYENSIGEIEKIKSFVKEEKHDIFMIENFILNNNDEENSPSSGEKAFIALDSFMKEDHSSYYLDEPGNYLGNKMITEYLINEIKKINMSGKSIYICTHISSIGLNTMPYNFIYKEAERYAIEGKEETFKTYVGNMIGENFVEINTGETKKFKDVIVNNFEGSRSHFDYRRRIYEH